MLKSVWDGMLHVGDVSGKLLTLITLPAALVAGWVYLAEIRDFLSTPDLRAEIVSVSMRCTVEISARNPGESSTDYQNRLCGAGNLSAWVTFNLTNADSIQRTIGAVRLMVDGAAVPALTKDGEPIAWPVAWTQARQVNEQIRNDRRVVTLTTWQPLTLAPGQEVQLDIDFRAFLTRDQVPFAGFRSLITDAPEDLANRPINLSLDLRSVGRSGWLAGLARCTLTYPAASLARAAQKPVLRALTRRCEPVN